MHCSGTREYADSSSCFDNLEEDEELSQAET